MTQHEKLIPNLRSPQDRARQRRGYLIQGLVVLLVIAGAVFAARSMLYTAPAAGSRPAPERQARLVDVVNLETTDYQPTITGWGTLMPSRDLTLHAQVSGPVESISPQLEPGMIVSRGEQLVKLETSPYRTALVEAQSALAEAEANLALEQGQQAIAQREFELLSQRSGASEAGRDLALREPQLRIAQSAVKAAKARLDQAQLNLERAIIEAPFEALVTSRSVTLGTQVTTSTDIARLVGVDTWWVEVLVPADQLTWIGDTSIKGSPGIPVTLHQPGIWGTDQVRQGFLLRVLQELEDQGNLARVLVGINDPLERQTASIETPAPRLLLGSFLQADIQGRSLENVFVLEPRWLRENNTVWLMDAEQTLRIHPVEVLYRDDDAVVVTAGLNPGDRLVTSRLSTPAEGMLLRTDARTDTVDNSGTDQEETTGSVTATPETTHG